MTIQLTIQLFGTLGSKVPKYDHKTGIHVAAPDDATPQDLLSDLKIPLSHVGFISDGSSAIQLGTRLTDNMNVNFYSLISGG